LVSVSANLENKKHKTKHSLNKECAEFRQLVHTENSTLPSPRLPGPQCQAELGSSLASWDEAHTTSRFPWYETALWILQKNLQRRVEKL
jgi:hypothetical protein